MNIVFEQCFHEFSFELPGHLPIHWIACMFVAVCFLWSFDATMLQEAITLFT